MRRCPQFLSRIARRGFRFHNWASSIAAARIDDGNQEAESIFLAAIRACSSARDAETGRIIHSDAKRRLAASHRGIFVDNSAVSMYAKCGRMADARLVFDGMPFRSVVSWTALISGYAENGEPDLALRLFTRMEQGESGCDPNERTYVAALMALADLAAKNSSCNDDAKARCLSRGRSIHAEAQKRGFLSDVFVATTLIDLYAKCGSLEDSRIIFDKMQSRNVVSWTAMILGHAENGEPEIALQMFDRMKAESSCTANYRTYVATIIACARLAAKSKEAALRRGIEIHRQAAESGLDSNMFLASALVEMYAQCGSLAAARGVFDKIAKRDVVSWTAMILACAENGDPGEALQIYRRMDCAPNAHTFVAVLLACGNLAALELGREIHSQICKLGLELNPFVANCLIDVYGKCGSIADAEHIFYALPDPTPVTWSALISGYSSLGAVPRVIQLFASMIEQQVAVDRVALLCVLAAYSHAGMIDRGRDCFQAMAARYNIAPGIEHYHCMIDMLGRANRLEEAVAMAKSMPHRQTLVTWMTILGACSKWRNVSIGKLALESIVEVHGKHGPALVLMANIYGSAGMWEKRSKTLAEIQSESSDP